MEPFQQAQSNMPFGIAQREVCLLCLDLSLMLHIPITLL